MSACATCTRGDHTQCTGFDGPMTTHPDSLPLCSCRHTLAEVGLSEKNGDPR